MATWGSSSDCTNSSRDPRAAPGHGGSHTAIPTRHCRIRPTRQTCSILRRNHRQHRWQNPAFPGPPIGRRSSPVPPYRCANGTYGAYYRSATKKIQPAYRTQHHCDTTNETTVAVHKEQDQRVSAKPNCAHRRHLSLSGARCTTTAES